MNEYFSFFLDSVHIFIDLYNGQLFTVCCILFTVVSRTRIQMDTPILFRMHHLHKQHGASTCPILDNLWNIPQKSTKKWNEKFEWILNDIYFFFILDSSNMYCYGSFHDVGHVVRSRFNFSKDARNIRHVQLHAQLRIYVFTECRFWCTFYARNKRQIIWRNCSIVK